MIAFPRKAFQASLRRTVNELLDFGHVGVRAPKVRDVILRYLERPAGFLRPRLLFASARAHAPEEKHPLETVMDLAVATELLHVGALLHDDLVDEYDAAPSLVFAGDLLFSAGFGLVGESALRTPDPAGIISTVRRAAAVTVVGQGEDLGFRRDLQHNRADTSLYELYDRKTGAYTATTPLVVGALAVATHPPDRPTLEQLGALVGRAYQLRDDVADLVALSDGERSATPWELNLAAAWLAKEGLSVPEDDGLLLAHLKQHPLESWARNEVDRLLTQAIGVVDASWPPQTAGYLRDEIASLRGTAARPESRVL